MHASHAAAFIYWISLFVSSTTGQSNLTFCNRLYHSVAVANNQLYIDGGELRTVWPKPHGRLSSDQLTSAGDDWQCISQHPRVR